MSINLPTPEQWHRSQHKPERDPRAAEAMADCWRCQRAVAHCKSKRTYDNVFVAQAVALEINVAERWVKPVRPYPCRVCRKYHVATAKTGRHKKRAERQRRKLIRAELERGA